MSIGIKYQAGEGARAYQLRAIFVPLSIGRNLVLYLLPEFVVNEARVLTWVYLVLVTDLPDVDRIAENSIDISITKRKPPVTFASKRLAKRSLPAATVNLLFQLTHIAKLHIEFKDLNDSESMDFING